MRIITDNATLYMIICMLIIAGGIFLNHPMLVIIGLIFTSIGLITVFNEIYEAYYSDDGDKNKEIDE